VGGNWKMHTDLASAVELADDIVAGCSALVEHCDVVVYPPFPYLQAVGKTLGHHGLLLGAQDVYHEPNGPYTGEVSTDMLLDLNVQVVLAGHSERRHLIGEDNEQVSAKVRAALRAGLSVVVCAGETLEQRQAGRTNQVIVGQIVAALRGVPTDQLRQVTVAYEPVWAIGTGKVAGPEDAAAVHRVIRRMISDQYDENTARTIRIQYGGSVNPENAAGLFAQPDIDGALVGGASLDSGKFIATVRAAVETLEPGHEARRG
jgi:triosephosphate isomerase